MQHLNTVKTLLSACFQISMGKVRSYPLSASLLMRQATTETSTRSIHSSTRTVTWVLPWRRAAAQWSAHTTDTAWLKLIEEGLPQMDLVPKKSVNGGEIIEKVSHIFEANALQNLSDNIRKGLTLNDKNTLYTNLAKIHILKPCMVYAQTYLQRNLNMNLLYFPEAFVTCTSY